MTAQSYPFGVWTPWANILCPACHESMGTEELKRRYPRAFSQTGPFPIFSHAQAQQERPNWTSELGQCDDCTCLLWMDESIAREQWFARQFKGDERISGFMMQTGGMCSAAGMQDKTKDFYLMVTCEEGILVYAYPEDENAGEWIEVFSAAESGPLIYSLAVDAIRDFIEVHACYADIDPRFIGDVTAHMKSDGTPPWKSDGTAPCDTCGVAVRERDFCGNEGEFLCPACYDIDEVAS